MAKTLGDRKAKGIMKANTLVLVLVAAIFGIGVYVWDRQQTEQPDATETPSGTPIFQFSEDEVQRLTIETPSQSLAFTKAAQGSAWVMETPETGPADEAAILFLVNLLATAQSQRTLNISPQQRQEFGLDQPTATVKAVLKNNQTHTLILGGKDYSGSAVYARVDPTDAETWAVELVPTTFLDAVDRPIAEWKPPAPSPTPSPPS